jgi:hypothetical protein
VDEPPRGSLDRRTIEQKRFEFQPTHANICNPLSKMASLARL